MATRHQRRERDRTQRARKQKRTVRRGTRRVPGWLQLAIVAGVAGIAILGAQAAGIFSPPERLDIDAIPQTQPEVGTKEPDRGNTHTPRRGEQVTYPTPLPPTSGTHWALPHAGWGVKDDFEEDEVVLHNMEHGGIAIQYKPGLEAQQLSDLKTLVRQLNTQGFPKVLLRPYAEMTPNIVATAWLWRLELERFDRAQLVSFVRSHYGASGDSPEPNAQ